MRFRHNFKVKASLSHVAAFHRQSRSMGAITPPPAIVRLHRAPNELGEGDEMEFTIWMGPLPIRWKALIEQVSPQGFTDRQLRSAHFKEWVHQHSFHPVDPNTTEIRDDVKAKLRLHPLVGANWPGNLVEFTSHVRLSGMEDSPTIKGERDKNGRSISGCRDRSRGWRPGRLVQPWLEQA
jgi:ligand-binding SRPBCC domain-containing protein